MHYFLNKEFTLENMKQALSEFQCQRCKPSCCTGARFSGGIALLPRELYRLAMLKGMSVTQFRARYVTTRKGKMHMNFPCPFYSEQQNGCTIWKHKPQVCIQFPFNQTLEKNGKLWMTCGDCAGGKKYAKEHHLLPEDYGVKD